MYSSLKDSIFNLDKTKQLAEIQTKYEIEKKNQENEILRKDQEVKSQIIRRQNFQNIASIVAIVFVLAFALYLYQNYKEKQRINQLLTEQNEKLSKRRQQIAAINDSLKLSEKKLNEANSELTRLNQGLEHTVQERTVELQQANEELDTFLYQSSHALRRPIAQVKGLIQLARMENGDFSKVEAVYDKIDDTSTRMDLMLRKLVMASEINLAKPNPERIDFKQVIQESWELLNNTMHVDQNVKLDYDISENIEYDADRRLINIIFNNLLENAILYQSNHRHRDGQVAVSITNGQSKVKIDISDNGIGISDAVIGEIFDLFSIGTDRTKGYGLGLYIVKKAVEKLNGEISVESKENEYTQFHLSLPLS
jgi:signal transduction histidine kinase